MLALLERQVVRLNRMSGDLLDATRIESGNLELQSAKLDLREPVREIVRLYAPVSPKHPLRFSAPTDPIWVNGDALRIEQVVSNLVSNAIKYSPNGGEVHVKLDAHDEEAWLDVIDEGRGIPEAELDTIFEPFRRRQETKHLAPGVGLGLSVVRRILQAQGATVEVSSAVGRGSTFRVRFPLLKDVTDLGGGNLDGGDLGGAESSGEDPSSQRPAAHARP